MTKRSFAGRTRFSFFLSLVGLLSACAVWELGGVSVRASGPACEYVAAQDLDGDGVNDMLTLRCSLPGGPDDRVYVLDRDGDLGKGLGWEESIDFERDVWLFDVGGNGDAQLIIDFHWESPSLVADLYDDQSGDGQVAYEIKGGRILLTESEHPTVRVVAKDEWWTRDTATNYNLDMYVDGPAKAVFQPPEGLEAWARRDGVFDVVIRVRDVDSDGRPDTDLRTVAALTGSESAVPGSFLVVNADDNEAPLQSVFPWPYLGSESYGYLASLPHQVSLPPIQVNWETGQITYVGELVASRGNDAQWFVYSMSPIQTGQVNDSNFENPFAWYDLAGDSDRQAELAIRHVYYPPGDPDFVQGRFDRPLNMIRYSWDQDNDGAWDYKLGLLGSHKIKSVVTASGIALKVIPYEELPAWVVHRMWGLATFVASEDILTTEEGIYVWDLPAWMTEGYFPGFADLPTIDYKSVSSDEFPYLPPGFRGDYQLALQDKPFLYVSSVDCKLHLVTSEAGMWNIDGRSEIRYANLDGDDYLDQWLYLEGGELRRQLDATLDYLVYAGEDRITLKQTALKPALLMTLPPSSREQWLALGQSLEQFSCRSAPEDFSAMVARFEGEEWQVQGAHMRGFRPDGGGFRFVLELRPGYRVTGTAGPEIEGLSPGTYVVSYRGVFDVQPLTPAQPHILRDSIRLGQGSATAFEPTRIAASLHNSGLEDLPDLWVQAYAQGPQEPLHLVGETSVMLLGGETRPFSLDWMPPAAGIWQFTLAWGGDSAELPDTALATTSFEAEVRAPQVLDVGSIWRLSNVGSPGALLVLLVSLGLTAAGLATIIIRLVAGAS